MDVTSLGIKVQSTGITEASKALGGLSTSAGNAEKRVTSLQAALARLDATSANIATSGNSYMRLLREQAALMQTMAASSRTAAGGTEALAAAMLLLSTALNLNNQQLQRNTLQQRVFNNEMREAHALARGLSGSLGALWLTYGNIAGMAVGLGIGLTLRGIVTVGADVENTLEGIRVRGGETIENANKVREAIYKIGEGVYGPQEVAKAFESLTLAGLKVKDSALAIGAALNLATSGGTSIEKAAEGLVSIGTAVGAVASDFDYLADGITAAANTSLASVDSITEAVKRASIVNKLYGASFDDILTQTAALAQLGIKNTAAGTAITNFYNNAVGNTNKSRAALEKLGMTFTDTTGKAKPLVEAFEEFTAKLNKYDLKSQQNFINDIFGERALRDVEALRDAVNKSADDTEKYSNKLREIQGNISNAAGTASLQAVQLGLTTSKQLTTVANTLKTSFAKAFEEVGPQITDITARLKEVFGSPEFINGITNLAVALANLVGFIVDNTKAIGYLVTGLLAYKVAMGVSALIPFMTNVLLGAASAFGATAVAANGAAVATGAFGFAIRALPVVGVILSVITVALGLLMTSTVDAKDAAEQLAETYNNNYAKALEDEVKRLENINRLKREGREDSEALAGAMKEEALARYELNAANQIGEAGKRLDAAKAAKNGILGNIVLSTAKQIELNKAQEEYNKLVEQRESVRSNAASVVFESGIQKQAYQAEQIISDILGKFSAGTEVYDRKKADVAGDNDRYASSQAKFDSQIKAAKKAMTSFEEAENEKFKAGMLGRLQVIQSVSENEIKEYTKIGEALKAKLAATSGGKNTEAEQTRISGMLEANNEALEVSKRKSASETATYLAKVREDTYKYQVKSLEEQGKYEEAAALKWSTEFKTAYQGMVAELDALGDKYPELAERVNQFAEVQEKMVNSGRFKDLLGTYDLLLAKVTGLFKGVQGGSEANGLASMVEAAFNASEKYKASLPELEAALIRLKEAADKGDPADQKKYEESLAAQAVLADKYKTMWGGVGESISKSLGSAFGSAGKAVGTLITQIVKFNDTDKKTTGQRIKAYGDMAGAAKGYFKEGTTGYKVLATAEKVFRAIELAEAIKVALVKSGLLSGYLALKTGTDAAAMASGSAYTIAEVAQAGLRATANGIAAVAKAIASMPFPLNIAAGVATAAALVGFGVKLFGGGGSGGTSSEERQKSQGTGSILGDSDAKSESIQRALDIIAKDSGLQLVHSQSMVVSLKQIVSGIGGLGSILNRAGLTGETAGTTQGAAASLLSSTLGTAVLGGVIGLTLDKLTGGFVSKITGSIANTIFGGKTSVQDTGLTIGKTSLGAAAGGVRSSQYTDVKKDGGLFSKDKYSTNLSSLGAEADDQFTMIINNLAKTVSSAADMLGVGGTAFTDHLNTFVVDIGKVSLKGLSGEEQQKALESVFSKLGDDMAIFAFNGLKDFRQVGEGYLETLARVANEVVQVSDVFAVLGKDFNLTGVSAIKLSSGLVAAAGDIETLTTNTKAFVDDFLTPAEKIAPITASLNKQLTKLGVSTSLTEKEFKNLVLSQDLTTATGQSMYAALIALAPAFKQSADYAWDLANGTVELTKAQQRAKDNIDKSRTALQEAYDEESSQLEKTIDKLTSFAAGLKSFQDGLLTGSSSPLTNAQKYAQTLTNFEAISAKAKAGDADAQAGFQAAANELLAASKTYNASSSAYTEDFNRVLKETANLASSTQTQIGTAQASLDALNKQVSGLITVNESVLSVTQAIINLQAALTAGRAEGLTDTQMGLAVDGSHASGLPFVPKDGYIAELHKGERVLTASEAVEYNGGRGQDSVEVVAALKVMEEKLTDAVDKLAAATVDSNFRATDAAAEKTVEGLDAIMTKKSEKVKPIKLN